MSTDRRCCRQSHSGKVNDERPEQWQDQKSRGMSVPLHTETMRGHTSAETIVGPTRAAAAGSFAILDVRQRVPDIPGEYTLKKKKEITGPD